MDLTFKQIIEELFLQKDARTETTSKAISHPHRWLNGAIVLADVVDNARDAERTGKAQQVGQEAERDAEDERSAKCFS